MLKLQFRDERKPAIWLVDPRYSIGSDASNDIVLDEEGISGFHAELRVEPGDRIHITDTGSAQGTWVNGQRIDERTALKAGDIIRIQEVELELLDPKQQGRRVPDEASATAVSPVPDFGAPARKPATSWKLVARTGSLVGQTFEMPASGRLLIGRSTDCDIVLPSQHVSREHAEVVLEQEQLKVRDLGSSNGTFVNRRKLEESILQADDEIRFDTLVFRVQGPQASSGSAEADRTAFRPAVSESASESGKGGSVSSTSAGAAGTSAEPGERPAKAGPAPDTAEASAAAQVSEQLAKAGGSRWKWLIIPAVIIAAIAGAWFLVQQ